MFRPVVLFWFILAPSLFAQVILTEVMFMPDTQSAYTEFVELYNAGNSAVDLSGWQIGDQDKLDNIEDAGSGLLLGPAQYGLILDPGYFLNSTIYDSLIPASALVMTIDAGSFGSRGFSNSVPETVILANSSGDTLQKYTYTLNNDPGFSDEKRVLTPDNSPANWENGQTFRGTPGAPNSVLPRQKDLALEEFLLDDAPLASGMQVQFNARIRNVGLESVNGFSWQTFYDWNRNLTVDAEEILQEQQESATLVPGDSMWIRGSFVSLPSGEIPFGLHLFLAEDQQAGNNTLVQSAFVFPQQAKIIINEIMANPLPGEPEWVELYNAGSEPIDFRFLLFSDSRDTIEFRKQTPELTPQSFWVITDDSVLMELNPGIASRIVVAANLPTLNNSFDDLKVFASGGWLLDRVPYNSDWYGRSVSAGTSLEKINPLLNGKIAANWAASVSPEGSTPARPNSVFIEALPTVSRLTIRPNPFSPDQDGLEDFTIIEFEVPAETAVANLNIFDVRGRVVRHLARNTPVASEGYFIWDGKDDAGRVARIGIYICLLQLLNSEKRIFRELKDTIVLYKK